MEHKTKEKGDLGLVKVISDLVEKKIDVLIPMSEHLPFDLVAFNSKNGKLAKIQVKYRAKTQGRIDLALKRNLYNNTTGAYSVPCDFSQFDYYAIYCPDTNKCYYIKTSEIEVGTKALSLRLDPLKANIDVKLASNFEKIDI